MTDVHLLLQALQHTLTLTFRHIGAGYSTFRLFRNNEVEPSFGPFYVLNNLSILALIIYKQKVAKLPMEDLTAQLLIGILIHMAYLIKTKQFAQIVYQVTILINVSWQIRQYQTDNIVLAAKMFQYLVCLSPLYNIIRSIQHKNIAYISKWQMLFYAIECTIWIICAIVIPENILVIWPPILKFLLIFLMVRIYAELTKRKKSKTD